MENITIKKAVGKRKNKRNGGWELDGVDINLPEDVKKIEQALNKFKKLGLWGWFAYSDGKCTEKTISAIRKFQKEIEKMESPTGRIEHKSITLQILNDYYNYEEKNNIERNDFDYIDNYIKFLPESNRHETIKSFDDRIGKIKLFKLLKRVMALNNPNKGRVEKEKYLIIGVQKSNKNNNQFDDEFYVFKGNIFIMKSAGTTHPGRPALNTTGQTVDGSLPSPIKDDDREEPRAKVEYGRGVWKTNVFYRDLYKKGIHGVEGNDKKSMPALRQKKPVLHYRDNDDSEHANETGNLYYGNTSSSVRDNDAFISNFNMHGSHYTDEKKTGGNIGRWSYGCQVWRDMPDYYKMLDLDLIKAGNSVDYALLRDW